MCWPSVCGPGRLQEAAGKSGTGATLVADQTGDAFRHIFRHQPQSGDVVREWRSTLSPRPRRRGDPRSCTGSYGGGFVTPKLVRRWRNACSTLSGLAIALQSESILRSDAEDEDQIVWLTAERSPVEIVDEDQRECTVARRCAARSLFEHDTMNISTIPRQRERVSRRVGFLSRLFAVNARTARIRIPGPRRRRAPPARAEGAAAPLEQQIRQLLDSKMSVYLRRRPRRARGVGYRDRSRPPPAQTMLIPRRREFPTFGASASRCSPIPEDELRDQKISGSSWQYGL